MCNCSNRFSNIGPTAREGCRSGRSRWESMMVSSLTDRGYNNRNHQLSASYTQLIVRVHGQAEIELNDVREENPIVEFQLQSHCCLVDNVQVSVIWAVRRKNCGYSHSWESCCLFDQHLGAAHSKRWMKSVFFFVFSMFSHIFCCKHSEIWAFLAYSWMLVDIL